MSRAGRAVSVDLGSPLDVPEPKSWATINGRKHGISTKIEPGQEIKASVRMIVDNVNKDEDNFTIHVEITDLIEQPKPQPEGNSDGPIRT